MNELLILGSVVYALNTTNIDLVRGEVIAGCGLFINENLECA